MMRTTPRRGRRFFFGSLRRGLLVLLFGVLGSVGVIGLGAIARQHDQAASPLFGHGSVSLRNAEGVHWELTNTFLYSSLHAWDSRVVSIDWIGDGPRFEDGTLPSEFDVLTLMRDEYDAGVWCGSHVMGWPMRAARYQSLIDEGAATFRFVDALRIPDGRTYAPMELDDALWLPLHPLWPGLAVNFLFYGLIGIVVTGFAGFAWRRSRTLRSRCPRCGYSRRGIEPAAPCPECGATA